MNKTYTSPPPHGEIQKTPPMLVNEISRLFFDRMRASAPKDSVLSQHGGRMVLMTLFHACDTLTQRDLAETTHLKAPTVSGILEEMEREGLITRLPDARDRRRTCVLITEKGRAAHEGIRARLREADAVLLRGFSEEEQGTLLALLYRMRENILKERTEGNDETV